MKKKTIILLIVASITLAVGLIALFISLAVNDFEWKAILPSDPYEEKFLEFDVTGEELLNIEISSEDIKFIKSTDDKVRINYYESNSKTFNFTQTETTIGFKEEYHFSLLQLFTFNIGDEDDIVVSLPAKFMGEVNLSVGSGTVDVNLQNPLDNLTINGASGNISLVGVKADVISLNTASGSILLDNVRVKHDLSAHTASGKINLENCSAGGKTTLNTASGKVSFTCLSSNEIEIECSSGDVDGTIDGNINDYSITSNTSSGNNNLPSSFNGGNKKLKVETSSGSIDITFNK